nr:hypothetical protein [Tanacetum cinerariifolium]
DEESFDPIVQTPSHVEDSDDDSNDDESHGMNVGGDEGPNAEDDDEELYRDSLSVSSQFVTSMLNPSPDAEDDDEELYRDVNINLEGRDVQMTDVHTTQVLEDTHVTLTLVNPDGQQQSLSMSSQFVTSMLNPSPDAVQEAPAPTPTTALSTSLQDLPNFGSLFGFDHRLKTLEANFSEFMQTNQFAGAVSSIPAQAENEYFLNKLDENIQKIIKEQVKEQVKTSYAVAADLSELELKKILIEKIESNKSIYRSYEQRNLYKALVNAYECDKIILEL